MPENGNGAAMKFVLRNSGAFLRAGLAMIAVLYAWEHWIAQTDLASSKFMLEIKALHVEDGRLEKKIEDHITVVGPLTREFTDFKAKTEQQLKELKDGQDEIKLLILRHNLNYDRLR